MAYYCMMVSAPVGMRFGAVPYWDDDVETAVSAALIRCLE
jgi:hypothetical protein